MMKNNAYMMRTYANRDHLSRQQLYEIELYNFYRLLLFHFIRFAFAYGNGIGRIFFFIVAINSLKFHEVPWCVQKIVNCIL